ncbi:hypothetical protein, partial [Heyndrickxia sporothermodurans]
IFIDLNMHAREVSRSRQILLDDLGIESRCLRQIIAERVGEEQQDRLPLGLIHWQHNESAKFNQGEQTGPFLTTVQLLHAIIQDIIDLKRPRFPEDEDQVRTFVRSIDEAFGLTKFLQENQLRYPNVKPLMSYVEENHLKPGFETPFSNPPAHYVRVCADSFAEQWRPIILDVLTRFSPYASFVEQVRERGGIDGDLAFFLVQPRRAQKAKKEEWGQDYTVKVDEPLKQLHKLKHEDWAFFAV